ncbi:hypothetical protein JTE90_017408 [Oedothorax gibbosus]|uniref:Uncharacterized protein n=1 Tax=Oedothorax gibbosus TaxID=931172 RepID=A0AAV6U8C1_9ARAC|nr:hypothetical protein JTE90_017408 [Oedothorax gibbosus]
MLKNNRKRTAVSVDRRGPPVAKLRDPLPPLLLQSPHYSNGAAAVNWTVPGRGFVLRQPARSSFVREDAMHWCLTGVVGRGGPIARNS